MIKEKKIEQYLRTAPKPPTPEGLRNKLRENMALIAGKRCGSIIRRWFAPTDGSISPWRVAAAAAIATMILLPLSYAGGKIVKTYIFTEGPKVEVIENEDGSVTKIGTLSVVTDTSGEQANEEEANEIEELRKAGKGERILVKEWVEQGMRFCLYKVSYTLSDGKVVTVNEIEAGSIADKSK